MKTNTVTRFDILNGNTENKTCKLTNGWYLVLSQ